MKRPVTSLVLGEACFLLQAGYLRRRLQFLLDSLSPPPIELAPPWWGDVFAWLDAAKTGSKAAALATNFGRLTL